MLTKGQNTKPGEPGMCVQRALEGLLWAGSSLPLSGEWDEHVRGQHGRVNPEQKSRARLVGEEERGRSQLPAIKVRLFCSFVACPISTPFPK